METQHTVSAATVLSFAEDLISLSVPPSRLEALLDTPLDDLSDPEAQVPIELLVKLEQQAPDLLDDPAAGISLGGLGHIDESRTGVVGYLARHSPTMGAAIRQAVRYSNLISTGIHMQLRTSGDSAEFVYTRPHPQTFAIVGVEVALVRMTATLHTVVGDDFHLQAAHFTYPRPAYVAAYGPVFGPHLHFEQPENLLRFPAEYLGVQIPGSQAYLHTVLETRAQTELEALEQHSGITYQVRKCILTRLAAGEATIEHIAKDLHVSRQTLYRQLKAEETTFQDLLDEIRRRLAASYLLNEGYSIMETAFLLGFSEASAFHRAFKRWYQQTPTTYIEAQSWSSGQARG